MFRLVRWGAAVLLALAVGSLPAQAEYPDVVLRSTAGERVMLSRFRGKPVIAFYEDRASTTLNEPVKKTLFERGKARGLLSVAHVVAVANIREWNLTPARQIAIAFIRRAEQEAGVPIYLDVDGTLSRPPLDLPATSSTVLVLDAEGRKAFERTGRLSDADTQHLLSTVERLTDTAPTPP